MKNIIISTIVIISAIFQGFSQDVIHFKNGKKLKVKVIHVKNDTIYYVGFYNKKEKVVSIDEISVIFFRNKNKSLYSKNDTLKNKTNLFIDKIKKNKEVVGFDWIFKRADKPLGVGIDLVIHDRFQSISGISADYFFNKYLNLGIGYGYFFGKPRVYATGKIIYKEIKGGWAPTTHMLISFIKLDKNLKQKLHIQESTGYFLTPSLGIQYRDKSGFLFDLKMGYSMINTSNSLSFSLRVALQM